MQSAAETNGPPPGAENTRVYSADDKAQILEGWLLAKAAGESERSISERLGVSLALIHFWKTQLERGGDLSNDPPPVRPRPAPPPPRPQPEPEPEPAAPPPPPKEPMPIKERYSGVKSAKPQHKGPRTEITKAQRREALRRWKAGEASQTDIAREIGIHPTTLNYWAKTMKPARTKKPVTPDPPTEVVEVATKKKAAAPIVRTQKSEPSQLGMFVSDSEAMQIAMMKQQMEALVEENKRLKAKVKRLMVLVVDDD